jgi:DNA-directed RNA polymerase specialized sigma24 family protein
MSNYTNSDYALNKYSAGIVYRFADGIVEITLADYLRENPGKTEGDFLALKKFSDADYHEEAKATYRQTWKNLPDVDADNYVLNAEISAAGSYFGEIEAHEEDVRFQEQIDSAHRILDALTEVQKRRFVMHRINGLTTRRIAEIEGCKQQSVVESLAGADKKIKKVLAKN